MAERRSTQLKGHGLCGEGKAYEQRDGKWHEVRPNWTGQGVCSCGEASPVLESNNARKRWHREHKAEVRTRQEVQCQAVACLRENLAFVCQLPEHGEDVDHRIVITWRGDVPVLHLETNREARPRSTERATGGEPCLTPRAC